MLKLLIATTNEGKLKEIQAALVDVDQSIILSSLQGKSDLPQVIEDGNSFLENARKKARIYSEWSGEVVLADDSGLVVEVLGGRPGVYSARYAGDQATDEDNRQKLLRELKDVSYEKRAAAFVCCLVVRRPDGREMVIEERCEGIIAEAPKGKNGFGYDPLFFVPEFGCTTAEMKLELKNKISHRGKALVKLRKSLLSFIQEIDKTPR